MTSTLIIKFREAKALLDLTIGRPVTATTIQLPAAAESNTKASKTKLKIWSKVERIELLHFLVKQLMKEHGVWFFWFIISLPLQNANTCCDVTLNLHQRVEKKIAWNWNWNWKITDDDNCGLFYSFTFKSSLCIWFLVWISQVKFWTSTKNEVSTSYTLNYRFLVDIL